MVGKCVLYMKKVVLFEIRTILALCKSILEFKLFSKIELKSKKSKEIADFFGKNIIIYY